MTTIEKLKNASEMLNDYSPEQKRPKTYSY